MKDFTLGSLLAVFSEMLGAGMFWLLVLLALLLVVAFIYVLFKRPRAAPKHRQLRHFIRLIIAAVGAVAAIAAVLAISSSTLANIGGPIDVMALAAIALLGSAVLMMLVYTLQGLFTIKRSSSNTAAHTANTQQTS